MNLCSNNPAVERAQPWLGTLVSIRVEGLPSAEAHRAIAGAFAEIAAIHRLMSFHDPASDVSRLNREAALHAIAVHPWTYSVLAEAQQFSRASDGCFDVSVAAELVSWGMLPTPQGAHEPLRGTWRDIELFSGNRVAFRRPLWIDLGGIAKGFAADRAVERLRECGARYAVVNAGGDMRVEGENPERIRLATPSQSDLTPVLELANGSVAGSSGTVQQKRRGKPACGPHIDGSRRAPAPMDRFVCVVAERCVVADALTKVAMARGTESTELLRRFSASAYLKDPGKQWLRIGTMETAAA